MTASASLDTIFRVIDDDEGACMEVRPSEHDKEFVILSVCKDETSQHWWGPVELTISKAFACRLSEALEKAST